jgi:hypothetical protein
VRAGRFSRCVGVLAGAGLFLVFAVAPAPRALAKGDVSLAEANRRWGGARCRLLFDVPVKKGRDRDGWSRSVYIVPAPGRKVLKGNIGSLLRVSNRDLVPGGVVRAGTVFVADGWTFEDPKGRDGLQLELRFEGIDARARLNFGGTFGKDFDADDLGEIERWVRLDIFDVSAADERLDDVAAPVSGAGAPPQPAPPVVPAPPAGPVQAAVLGVATEPLKVAPGGSLALVVTYEVRGVAAGRTVEVTERRTLLRDGAELTTLEAVVARAAGVHRSTQPLVVPAGLAPGLLEVRATVTAGGPESSGRTLFEVTAR